MASDTSDTERDTAIDIRERYLRMVGIAGQDSDSFAMRREAYRIAHDIRKFEIELYWRRATYFWGFHAAFLAAAGIVLSGTKELAWFHAAYISAISAVAVSFSCLWVVMTNGAKFWQNNWERHVDLLEDDFSGGLYKVLLLDREFLPAEVNDSLNGSPFSRPLGELIDDPQILRAMRPYSVTKANLYIVYALSFFWFLVFLVSGYVLACFAKGAPEVWHFPLAVVYYFSVLAGVFFFILQFRASRGYLGLRMGPDDPEFLEIIKLDRRIVLAKRDGF